MLSFAKKMLSSFGSTYLCEQTFSATNLNKKRLRSSMSNSHLLFSVRPDLIERQFLELFTSAWVAYIRLHCPLKHEGNCDDEYCLLTVCISMLTLWLEKCQKDLFTVNLGLKCPRANLPLCGCPML